MVFDRVLVELSGVDVYQTLSVAAKKGIVFRDVKSIDALSCRLWVPGPAINTLRNLAEKCGDNLRVISRVGLHTRLSYLKSRCILLIYILALVFLSVWIPKHILFVSVQGNERVSKEKILQQAEKCGIFFGANREQIRSAKLKNQLIQQMPELAWVGINSKGCTAEIRVKEKATDNEPEIKSNVSNIVANCDGIITSLTVHSGVAACKIGDVVKAGQVVISGYQDLGRFVKLTCAKGEIFAKTSRVFDAVSPCLLTKDEYGECYAIRYGIIIGKNRINLSNNSGIYYDECDKIYEEYSVILPGGFVLPLAFVREYIYSDNSSATSITADESLLLNTVEHYLLDQSISAEIINRNYSYHSAETIVAMAVTYDCVEMIGRERIEEYQFDYGKND